MKKQNKQNNNKKEMKTTAHLTMKGIMPGVTLGTGISVCTGTFWYSENAPYAVCIQQEKMYISCHKEENMYNQS